jgi:hypothetical protein
MAPRALVVPLPGVNENLRNPPDLANWRAKLFALDEAISMSKDEYDTYFLYVSNVWSCHGRPYKRQVDDTEITYYDCRFALAPSDAKEGSDPNARWSTVKIGATCNCRMRVERSPSGEYHLERYSEPHLHTMEQSDRKKRNDGLRKRAEELLIRGLAPAAVDRALRGTGRYIDGAKQLEDAGGAGLKRQDLVNWARAYQKKQPDFRTMNREACWKEQRMEACTLLDKKDWLFKSIDAQREEKLLKEHRKKGGEVDDEAHGIVFARPSRLERLRKHGVLVLIDATHRLNYLKWYLFTIMVRDKYEAWWPVGHLLSSTEDSNIQSTALRELKKWCRELDVGSK